MPKTATAKRKDDDDDDCGGELKRHKTTLNKIADEYVCPITAELPVDPVIAPDGRVYERSAIEELIERQGDALRSPVTNERMGPGLIPAFQVRNTIEELVRGGTVDQDIARRWKKRLEDEEHVAELKEKANGGDLDATYWLGRTYYYGLHGVKRDRSQAVKFWKKAVDRHYPPAMARWGAARVLGKGIEKNETEGSAIVGMAAYKDGGSASAAFYLARWYMHGKHSFAKDNSLAKYWLRRIIDRDCKFEDLHPSDLEKAKEWLNMLKIADDSEIESSEPEGEASDYGTARSDSEGNAVFSV